MKRRDFVAAGALIAGGTALAAKAKSAAAAGWDKSYSGGRVDVKPKPPGLAGRDYRPVITPNGSSLEWRIVDGVKVFHLVAGEVEHEFAPGLKASCWGYNGRVNATTIEAVEGERVRIYVTNELVAPTTVHWHGLYLPNGMDGVSGVTQAPIPPGKTFKYEFTLRQSGSFMYHSHHDTMTQEAMGLIGMFIIHPRNPSRDHRVDRDFAIMLSEWKIVPGTSRPNTLAMGDFNVLTMNGRAFPGTDPLVIKTGERVRIRFGNLSAMDHHPIHLHGYRFKVTATDGERIPDQAQWPETTVLVAVGQTRDVEFVADAPGDWLMHCHMTHHVMNQMGHDFPNMIGVDTKTVDEKMRPLLPGYMSMGQKGMSDMGKMKMPAPKNSIPMLGLDAQYGYFGMGGMFTLVKVRDELASYDDPGWYEHPPGTVADEASAAELQRDGIKA
jgi:FtsP/CotA-like multicopper oxidase with cupredoxin domain